MGERRTAVAFVHLGPNPAPTLIAFAAQAQSHLTDSSLFLITDHPSAWSEEFPGHVLAYDNRHRREIFESLAFRFPVLAQQAGGYAIRTLERLFALERLSGETSEQDDILHFESDVISFVGPEIREILRERCDRTAVPTVSDTKGCASILYAPNLPTLRGSLDDVEQLIPSDGSWLSDMQLLSLAIRAGNWQELPTHPKNAWPIELPNGIPTVENRLLFDAAAIGLYLFGLDPLHTSGVRASGHQHPDFPFDLPSWQWTLRADPSQTHALVGAQLNEGPNLIFANLHIHAKWNPGTPSPSNLEWERIVAEANGERARQEISAEPIYEFEGISARTRLLQRWREPKGALVKRLARKMRP